MSRASALSCIGSMDEEAMQSVPSHVAGMLGITSDLLLAAIVGRVTALQGGRLP